MTELLGTPYREPPGSYRKVAWSSRTGTLVETISCRIRLRQEIVVDATMTKLMERAIAAVQAMPPETQDELASLLLRIAGDDDAVVELTEEEAAAIEESLAQADRGEFATDDEVRAMLGRHQF